MADNLGTPSQPNNNSAEQPQTHDVPAMQHDHSTDPSIKDVHSAVNPQQSAQQQSDSAQEPESAEQPTARYRLAPQYGAFDSRATQTQPTQPIPTQSQPTQQFPTQPAHYAPSVAPRVEDPQPHGYAQGQSNPYEQSGIGPFVPENGANNAADNNGNGTGTPTGNGPFGPFNPQDPNNPAPDFNSPNPPKKSGANPVVVGVVSAAVAVILSLGVGYAAIENGWVSSPAAGSLTSLSTNTGGNGTAKVEGGETANWVDVIKAVSPSVVSITTQLNDGAAQGSGAIIDAQKGYIITNNHVISGEKMIQVTLNNGDLYTADVVGTDVTTDLAVLKLQNPPSNLKAVTFADSNNLASGEQILSIGNPLGYEGTSTSGIVSALNRPVTVMDDDSNTTIVTNAVQIDSAINPGNSGGPTFNAAGQVVGINSSIASMASSSSEAGSIGIGFAIPSNLAKQIADEIIKDGKATHVALGITIATGTAEADGVTRAGAVVKSVTDGAPGAKAGLKTGDVIVGFNGNEVSSMYSLLGFVRAEAMGSTAKLTVIRDGKTITLDVTFDQEESTVTGSNRSESEKERDDQRGNSNGNGNSEGNDSNGNGNGNSNGNEFGFTDPFGLW